MSQEKNVIAVLFGAAVGAGLGVLFAPDKGSETRKKIAKNTNKAKETMLSEAERLKDNVTTKANDIKSNIEETFTTKKETLDEKLETIMTDASYKAEDIISGLEEKLKSLKAKTKKLQTK